MLQLQNTLQAFLPNLKIYISRFSMKRLHSHTCIEFASGLRNKRNFSYWQRSAYSPIDSPLNPPVKNSLSYEDTVAYHNGLCIWGDWKCKWGGFMESSSTREHCMTESVHVWRFPWSGPHLIKGKVSMKGGHGLKKHLYWQLNTLAIDKSTSLIHTCNH